MTARTTRRGLLAAGGAFAGGLLAGRGLTFGQRGGVALGPAPSGRPAAQHRWEVGLRRDADGNAVAARFQSLVLLHVAGRPAATDARRLEAVLRVLERSFPWSADGLLFALAWGPSYFEDVLGIASPVEKPRPLSDLEDPALERHHACLHLACDDERRLSRVEQALLTGARLHEADGSTDLRRVFEVAGVRRGFVGEGLPRGHRGVVGVPAGAPIPPESPLFMGFRSGFRRNQASEAQVTIGSGPFAGGTTMHLSRIELSLDDWYGVLDERERVARMFAPQVTPGEVARFTDDAPSHPELLDQAARKHGVVGHAQAAARARRDGAPLILRRDFDSVDGGRGLVHFVALQRSIADFVRTREAMNAARAIALNPSVGPQINNGINEWMQVTARANFVVPPRRLRSFPLLPAAGDVRV